METPSRSLAKAISYRVVSIIAMTSVVWLITGQLTLAAAAGLGDAVLKIGLFYAHERIWTRIRYGQARPPEYEI